MVQGVKELAAELKPHPLRDCEVASYSKIQSLHSRPVDGIAAHVSECERLRSGERERIEPFGCGAGAGAEYGLPGKVCANRIFAENGSRVGGVAKNGNREWEPGLHLINRRNLPMLCHRARPAGILPTGNGIYRAQCETVSHVAAGPFLRCEVVVVLRNGSLKHWRAEIRSVTQIFCPCEICEQGQPVLITAPNVHIARVVPALGGIFEQIDRAYRKAHLAGRASARRRDVGHASRQSCIWHKCDFRKWPPRADGAGSGKRVVDQVRALQMNAVGSEIADFKRGVLPEALLD